MRDSLRPGRGDVRDVRGADGVLWTVYPRPIGARIWEVVGPLIGLAFAIGGLLVGLLIGVPAGLPVGLFFVVLGLLLGALMAMWVVFGTRRALLERDGLRISALGLWIPMVGTIPWSDVAAIEVEDAARVISSLHSDEAPLNRTPRLVIRLRPGATAPSRARFDRFFLSLGSRRGAPAVFGIYGHELPVSIEDVLRAIEAYRPVRS